MQAIRSALGQYSFKESVLVQPDAFQTLGFGCRRSRSVGKLEDGAYSTRSGRKLHIGILLQ